MGIAKVTDVLRVLALVFLIQAIVVPENILVRRLEVRLIFPAMAQVQDNLPAAAAGIPTRAGADRADRPAAFGIAGAAGARGDGVPARATLGRGDRAVRRAVGGLLSLARRQGWRITPAELSRHGANDHQSDHLRGLRG